MKMYKNNDNESFKFEAQGSKLLNIHFYFRSFSFISERNCSW